MAEKKINGRNFIVEPMLATRGLVLKARLMKVAAPVLSVLPDVFAGAAAEGEAKEAANFKAIAAFGELFGKGDPEEVASLIKDICEVAQIRAPSGEVHQVDLDAHMTGHDADIPPLVIFVLREQFSDFFSGLRGIGNLGSLKKA